MAVRSIINNTTDMTKNIVRMAVIAAAIALCPALWAQQENLVPTQAQDSAVAVPHGDILRDMEQNVTIHQSKEIEALMNGKLIEEKRVYINRGHNVHTNTGANVVRVGENGKRVISSNPIGYRVEVFQSSDPKTGQAEANRLRAQLSGKVSSSIYVRFNPPFWRVRIGDFRTIKEANDFKAQLLQRFPSLKSQTYVTRDHIKINMLPPSQQDQQAQPTKQTK